MWVAILSKVLLKVWTLLKSPVTWILMLAFSTIVFARLWGAATAEVEATKVACDERAKAALQAALQEREQAWLSVFAAHQEAVVRLATAEAKQAASARHWLQKYQTALNSDPDCAKWAQAQILCPIE